MNGVDKYVTESMPTKEEEILLRRNPLLKQDQQKPTATLTSVSILVRDRKNG